MWGSVQVSFAVSQDGRQAEVRVWENSEGQGLREHYQATFRTYNPTSVLMEIETLVDSILSTRLSRAEDQLALSF